MLRVGLTGGIGAGKSAVARALVEHGAVVIDADQLARGVVEPGTPGLAGVVQEFGDTVLQPDGSLDRDRLGAIVFSDPKRRKRLNAIVHPLVAERTAALLGEAPADAIVVQDIPLLVENGLAPQFALVIVVESPQRLRVERLMRDRGMSEGQVRDRFAAQASDEERRAVADVVLVNDGDLANLASKVAALWQNRLVPFEANLRTGQRAPRKRAAVLVPYDRTWPAQAARLVARLDRAVGKHAQRIDHIGSTSVPDLPAKELIDLQVVVADPFEAEHVADHARLAGFVRVVGEPLFDVDRNGVAHEEQVAVDADPERPVNVHIRAVSSPAWREALLFRDWLRSDPIHVREYAEVKQALADRPNSDVDRYSLDKRPWINEALGRAERWADTTGWSVPDSTRG